MRIAYWSPIPIWPIRSGSQARMAEMLRSLVALGHDVHLRAPLRTKRMEWGQRGVSEAQGVGIVELDLWEPSRLDLFRWHVLHPFVRRYLPGWDPYLRLHLEASGSGGFRRLVERVRSESVFLNYSFSAPLAEATKEIPSLCDLLDVLTVNYRLQSRIRRRRLVLGTSIGALEPAEPSDPEGTWGLEGEMALIRRFDGVIAISENDHRIVRDRIGSHRIEAIPMVFGPCRDATIPPSTNAGVLLGDNPMNLEGLAWLLQTALPAIRARVPSFEVIVAGDVCRRLEGVAEGVRVIGRTGRPEDFYDQVGLVLCPTYMGTGEQFKIGEAMSHRRATVAFDWMSSPVREGLDGRRCRTSEEFVHAVVDLVSDLPALRRMGESGWKHVGEVRGRERAIGQLGGILDEIVRARHGRTLGARPRVGTPRGGYG